MPRIHYNSRRRFRKGRTEFRLRSATNQVARYLRQLPYARRCRNAVRLERHVSVYLLVIDDVTQSEGPVHCLLYTTDMMRRPTVKIVLRLAIGICIAAMMTISASGESRTAASATPDSSAPLPAFGFDSSLPVLLDTIVEIGYSIPDSHHLILEIFDITGARVSTLTDISAAAGNHTAHWNGLDHNNVVVPNGVYFFHLACDDLSDMKKFLVVR